MSNRFSSTALVALAAAFTFTALAPSSAQARQEHWFYNDYDRYDEDAYGDDEVVYDNGYRDYEQSRREQKRLKRLRKMRNKARRQARRQRRQSGTRPGRQRLYDAWQGSYPQPAPVIMSAPSTPRYQRPQQRLDQRAAQRPFRLSYVPLPRRKPYHLIPTVKASTEQPVATTSFDRDSETRTFDQRPRWNPTPEISTEKTYESTRLPQAIPLATTTEKRATLKKPIVKKPRVEKVKPENKPGFKPIRIEVAKANKSVTPVQQPVPLAKPPRSKKPRLAANQLSCNKAKSIVSGFGFSDVTPRTCTGNVYDFKAKRDGKPYSIKVSSLSGELKAVKKIK